MYRTLSQVMNDIGRRTNYERMPPRTRKSRMFNLDRMRALMKALGNPESSFRSIHIGGTNGKGSTALMLENILLCSGKTVGTFTSPHLVHVLERIRVGGSPVEEKVFIRSMNRMKKVLDRIRPTFFEIMNAAAFLIFQEEKVDWALVEVGLGGRLDSTNILSPKVSILTTIDLDHMEVLGSSISEIAKDKAGIIKSGIPIFTSARKREALSVITRKAKEVGSPFHRLGREIRITGATRTQKGVLQFRVERKGYSVPFIRLPLLGQHQVDNGAIAVSVAQHIGVKKKWIEKGLASLQLPGRIEVVRRRPDMIVDVGHNPAAIRALVRALPARKGKSWLVFGAAQDKDWEEMLRILKPHVDAGFMTRANHPRACSPSDLARAAHFPAEAVSSVSEAVSLAQSRSTKKDRILITGSFSVAGEALKGVLSS
jgi:dihydrofolate synthase/folylpolyglutamate synthase